MEVDLISHKPSEGTPLASSNFPKEDGYTLRDSDGQQLTPFYALSTACRPRADPSKDDSRPPGNLWSGCKLNGMVSTADPKTGHQRLQIEPPVWISPSIPWRFVKNGTTVEEQYGSVTHRAEINTYLDTITVANLRPGPCTITLSEIEKELKDLGNSDRSEMERFYDRLYHPVEFVRDEITGLDCPVDGGGIPIDMSRFCRGTLKYKDKGLSGILTVTNHRKQNTVDLGVVVMFVMSPKVNPSS